MKIAYLRLKKKVILSRAQYLQLKDLAKLSLEHSPTLKENILNTYIYKNNELKNGPYIVNAFQMIEKLQKLYPFVNFQIIGSDEVLIDYENKQKSSIFMSIVVWLVLCIGTAMTIINFHYDVSMQEVQQKIHYFITGEKTKHPLWMQIPYSLGLGIGMLLFFNHFLKYKFSKDPSPLEIELFKYNEDVRKYLISKNNDKY